MSSVISEVRQTRRHGISCDRTRKLVTSHIMRQQREDRTVASDGGGAEEAVFPCESQSHDADILTGDSARSPGTQEG